VVAEEVAEDLKGLGRIRGLRLSKVEIDWGAAWVLTIPERYFGDSHSCRSDNNIEKIVSAPDHVADEED
jgi:hypothetical protein